MTPFCVHEAGARTVGATPRRVSLITGGSDGIGAACVREFRASGWNVSVVALPGRDLDRQHAAGILTVAGDVTWAQTRDLAVEQTLRHYGRIDVLVNCAGIGLYGVPSEVPLQWIPRLFDTNVVAPLALAQLIIPVMRKQGAGTIVNMSSIAASVALPWAAAYSASKAALNSVHDSLRRELRGGPVRVIKVCPGIVDTRFREHVLSGSAPTPVCELRWVVSPQAVARRILRAIDRGNRTVYIPRIGALFALAGVVAPGLMDFYLARFLASNLHQQTSVGARAGAEEAP
jgi:short-subunit dehydrogenase